MNKYLMLSLLIVLFFNCSSPKKEELKEYTAFLKGTTTIELSQKVANNALSGRVVVLPGSDKELIFFRDRSRQYLLSLDLEAKQVDTILYHPTRFNDFRVFTRDSIMLMSDQENLCLWVRGKISKIYDTQNQLAFPNCGQTLVNASMHSTPLEIEDSICVMQCAVSKVISDFGYNSDYAKTLNYPCHVFFRIQGDSLALLWGATNYPPSHPFDNYFEPYLHCILAKELNLLVFYTATCPEVVAENYVTRQKSNHVLNSSFFKPLPPYTYSKEPKIKEWMDYIESQNYFSFMVYDPFRKVFIRAISVKEPQEEKTKDAEMVKPKPKYGTSLIISDSNLNKKYEVYFPHGTYMPTTLVSRKGLLFKKFNKDENAKTTEMGYFVFN